MSKSFSLCLLALSVAVLTACGGGGGDDDDDGGGGEPMPTAQQVDRMGRPGITTGVISSGNKDAYNRAFDRSQWAPLFQADIQSNLQALDSLDGIPNNLLLNDPAALAAVLVDDRLVINTSIPTCDEYLAVELGLTTACGGRTLPRDVIDDTLTALVGSPASDNVPLDSAFLVSFPFLGPPNGVQLDRMGRPGINTALITTPIKDAYNLADDRSTWASLFKNDFVAFLNAYDSLDGIPGNALLGDSSALAEVLVDDRLIIDTSIPTCDEYLAVELGLATACGGRTLARDVIDDTLTALVGLPTSDNVPDDSTSLPVFPFLSEPN